MGHDMNLQTAVLLTLAGAVGGFQLVVGLTFGMYP
jgi:hypothetical protein